MESVNMIVNVSITADKLGEDIYTHVFDATRVALNGNVSAAYGQIVSVNRIVDIISINHNLMCNVVANVDVINMGVGDVVSGVVTMLCEHGIFFIAHGKCRVLVPTRLLPSFKHDDSGVTTMSDVAVNLGDVMDVRITRTSMTSKSINYIGELR